VGADAPIVVHRRGDARAVRDGRWTSWSFGVTVILGLSAGSVALVAFPLDSFVEVFASAV
jgi:hypothetical protein